MQAEFHEADERQDREENHRALREVEHRRGLVDQDEAQRDERIHDARKQAADENLEEEDDFVRVHSSLPQCATPR